MFFQNILHNHFIRKTVSGLAGTILIFFIESEGLWPESAIGARLKLNQNKNGSCLSGYLGGLNK